MVNKAVVLDSDVLIDFLRTGQGTYVDVLKKAAISGVDLYLSSVTIFEIFSGQSSKAQLDNILEIISNFKVYPFDYELGRFVGELKRDHKLDISLADLIITGTALQIGAAIVTRNRKHFKNIPNLKFFEV